MRLWRLIPRTKVTGGTKPGPARQGPLPASVIKVLIGAFAILGVGALAWAGPGTDTARAAPESITPVKYDTAEIPVPTVDCAVSTGTLCGVVCGFPVTVLEGDTVTYHAGITLCAAVEDSTFIDSPSRYYSPDPDPKFQEMAFHPISGTPSANFTWKFSQPDSCGPDLGGWGTHACEGPGVQASMTLSDASAAVDNVKFGLTFRQPIFPFSSNPEGLDYDACNSCNCTFAFRVLKPQLSLSKQVCVASGQPGAESTCTAANESAWVKEADPVANFPDGTKVYWRIVVTNTGNADLQEVKLASDVAQAQEDASMKLAEDATASCLSTPLSPITHASTGTGGTVNLTGGTTPSDDGSMFTGGGSAAVVCSTDVQEGFTGTIVNTARAQGTFTDLDPNKDPLVNRLPGGKVISNDDSATATLYAPKLTLTKEVCSTGTGCVDHSNPAGTWVSSTIVKEGTPAEWRITVRNDGDVDIDNIMIAKEEIEGGAGNEGIPDGCDIGSQFGVNNGQDDRLGPGDSFSITCLTEAVSATSVALVNTAAADGQPLNPAEPGQPLPGYDGQRTQTNEDSATVIAADPALTLKKYACARGTDCTYPSAPFDADDLDTDHQWLDTEDDQTPTRVLVPDGGSVQWLIVATNSGNANLASVTLSADDVTGNTEDVKTTCVPGTAFPLPADREAVVLAQGESTALSCTSGPLTAGGQIKDTINTAQATAIPVLDDGITPVPGFGAQDLVESNTDIAKAAALDMKLNLKKYACQAPATGTSTGAGTGCQIPAAPPVTDQDLAEAGWHDTDNPGDHVIVAAGQPVSWLFVARNDGNVDLTNLAIITDELTTGPAPGTTATESGCLGSLTILGDPDTALIPGGFAVRTCTTTQVAATSPPTEVVNKAGASGMPMNPESPGEKLNGVETTPIESNLDVARAEAFTAHLTLVKEVCATGTGCTGDPDAQWVAETQVAPGTDAEWRLTVTNDGDVPVTDIEVISDVVTGGTTGNGPTPPGCTSGTPFSDGTKVTLEPGGSFSLWCTSESVTDTTTATVNTAVAGGRPLNPGDPGKTLPGYDEDGLETDPASAQVTAIEASIGVKKYACARGTGCAVPAAPFSLASLDTHAWLDTNMGDTPSRVLIDDGGTIQWLIVATNTGQARLSPVTLNADALSGNARGVPTTCKAGASFPLPGPGAAQGLAPGASTAIDCQSGPIAATSPLESTINTAQVAGSAVSDDGTTPVPGYGQPVVSGSDIAQAAAVDIGLTLKKYACSEPATGAGTGCQVPASQPVSAESLAALGWHDTDRAGDHVIVKEGAAVDWLIVVRNTGQASFSELTVATDLVRTGTGLGTATTEYSCLGGLTVLGSAAPLLDPGDFAVRQCRTSVVKATSPATEVINAATASGMPMNPDDPSVKLNGPGTAPFESDPDVARAQAATPCIELTKWVCPQGRSCAAAGFLSPQDPGPWVAQTQVAPGTTATWLIVVANTGNVPLKGVTLTTESLQAAGAGARAADAQACVAAFGAQGIAAGSFATAVCTSASVAQAESPLDNRAAASGLDPYGTKVTSGPGTARVIVAPPTAARPPTAGPSGPLGPTPPASETLPPVGGPALAIVKEVCKTGTGCDLDRNSDWGQATTLPSGTAPTWRIVVANTGSEPVRGLRVTDALSGSRSGPEASCTLTAGPGDTLNPGYRIQYLCASSPVTKADSGLVNSARATATGVRSGTVTGTAESAAKVLVLGGTGTLPVTGFASLGLGVLALVMIASGAAGVWLRRPGRDT